MGDYFYVMKVSIYICKVINLLDSFNLLFKILVYEALISIIVLVGDYQRS